MYNADVFQFIDDLSWDLKFSAGEIEIQGELSSSFEYVYVCMYM